MLAGVICLLFSKCKGKVNIVSKIVLGLHMREDNIDSHVRISIKLAITFLMQNLYENVMTTHS